MESRENVVIGAVGDRELHANLYLPDSDRSCRTAIIHLHGGGWRIGSPKSLALRSEALAHLGFTVVAAEYRLLEEAPWPAQLNDVQNAVRWTVANLEDLGVDAHRVVIVGHSSGAHLGLCAASLSNGYDSSEGGATLAAVVAFYPPVWFIRADEPIEDDIALRGRLADGTTPSWMLLGDGATDDLVAEVSPVTRLGPGFPPTCILHGLVDRRVDASSSQRFHQALIDVGVEAELHLYSRQGHGFDSAGPYLESTVAEVALFLQKTVVDPEGFAQSAKAP